MLGEVLTNWNDANKYYEKYMEAAQTFNDSISVKLSAIHPNTKLEITAMLFIQWLQTCGYRTCL